MAWCRWYCWRGQGAGVAPVALLAHSLDVRVRSTHARPLCHVRRACSASGLARCQGIGVAVGEPRVDDRSTRGGGRAGGESHGVEASPRWRHEGGDPKVAGERSRSEGGCTRGPERRVHMREPESGRGGKPTLAFIPCHASAVLCWPCHGPGQKRPGQCPSLYVPSRSPSFRTD